MSNFSAESENDKPMPAGEAVGPLTEELYYALRNCYTIEPIPPRYPEFTIDDAYAVSLGMLERRREAGETVIGKKIGVTSKAVQNMLNVGQPDFGFLTDAMQVANGAQVKIAGHLIQPRAEAEIAFRLGQALKGSDISETDVAAATEGVYACFEIVDSRIRDWKIGIEDTIADNASCGVFVLGDEMVPLNGLNLLEVEAVVHKNGKLLSRGLGAAAMGSPLKCVAWLARALARYDMGLEAGDIVLSGSLVPLEPAKSGDHFMLEMGRVGSASVRFN